MKFSEYVYERPDYQQTSAQMNACIDLLLKAKTAEEFYNIFMKYEKINEHVLTMDALCSIRHSINTADEFYNEETDYWDETNPLYGAIRSRMASAALAFEDRESLYEFIPKPYFLLAECEVKSFDEKIIPLLQKENKLTSEYGKLKATAQIICRGETYNLGTIGKIINSDDRSLRKDAMDAKWKFYSDHEAEFDRIYDELVKVRTEMAQQLGYKNFTELGYMRMSRLDYNQEMVANYRKQILDEIVPVTVSLREKQAKRLSVNSLAYYDEGYRFTTGNPTPKGTSEDLVNTAVNMYHQMSKETGEFIDLMNDNELWDLVSKDNKQMGGYTNGLVEYKIPFIFSNFNGTSGDVDVLTHEAGHAFMYFMSKDIEVTECQWPTMESCEIHSMSMEFFAYPWMGDFFKEDKDKYYYSHLDGSISFLPYGVLVDHFQHEVYNHPEMSMEERKQCYRKLEKMYLPHKDYSGCDILEKGCWWYQQGHIFESPFYYIDYTLAAVCAMQFFVRVLNKDENAWKDYLHLCKLGGSMTFTQLVKEANLIVPFEDGCVKSIAQRLKTYLDEIDDSKL